MCDSCPCQEQVVNKGQQAQSVQDFVSETSTAKNTETLDQLALFFLFFYIFKHAYVDLTCC